MFEVKFTSFKLLFGKFSIIISWDTKVLLIERITEYDKAFTENNDYYSCLSIYKKATNLSYRTNSNMLVKRTEAKRTINTYKKLIYRFSKLFDNENISKSGIPLDLYNYLEKAESSIYQNNLGVAISNFEFILTTLHQFLLKENQGEKPFQSNPNHSNKVKPCKPNIRRILFVDDDKAASELYILALQATFPEYDIIYAKYPDEAIQCMISHDVDLIITDLMMVGDGIQVGGGSDAGLEFAKAAKKISPNAKIVILTNYPNNYLPLDHQYGGSNPVDIFVKKPSTTPSELTAIIQKLLDNESEMK